jgi:hypothetical protein
MKRTKLYGIKVEVTKLAPIENAMNPQDQQKTGLSTLSAKQLANLNAWLDKNAVLAPGPISN